MCEAVCVCVCVCVCVWESVFSASWETRIYIILYDNPFKSSGVRVCWQYCMCVSVCVLNYTWCVGSSSFSLLFECCKRSFSVHPVGWPLGPLDSRVAWHMSPDTLSRNKQLFSLFLSPTIRLITQPNDQAHHTDMEGAGHVLLLYKHKRLCKKLFFPSLSDFHLWFQCFNESFDHKFLDKCPLARRRIDIYEGLTLYIYIKKKSSQFWRDRCSTPLFSAKIQRLSRFWNNDKPWSDGCVGFLKHFYQD